MEVPETQYADSGGVSIAYQVVGDGPLDLLVAPGFISHLDLLWGYPSIPSFYERLSSFARVILYDKRGTGLSDPCDGIPTIDERVDDMRAVLDAVGSERTAIFGVSEGGPMAVFFAATYPERTHSLVIYGSYAHGRDPAMLEVWGNVERLADNWGKGDSLALFSPSLSDNPVLRRLVAVFERASASPAMARALVEAVKDMDVRPLLGAVQVPALVLHREGDRAIPVSQARVLGDAIPGARLVVLPGDDHNPWIADYHAILDEIVEFLTGRREQTHADRVLTTLLFTDIVSSTEQAAAQTDARWRDLLAAHNDAVRRALDAHGGREVNTTGDGFVARFERPGRAVECAQALRDLMQPLGIQLRAGVHTGEVEVIGDDVTGMAVHLAARVCAAAGPGEILVSSTVRDLVTGAGFVFDDRGEHELKGVLDAWRLYALGDATRPPPDLGVAADHMGVTDRMMVRMATRVPRASRLFARLAGAPR